MNPDEPELLTVPSVRPCAACGAETNLMDADFEAHVCSAACVRLLWAEYWATLRALDLAPFEYDVTIRDFINKVETDG